MKKLIIPVLAMFFVIGSVQAQSAVNTKTKAKKEQSVTKQQKTMPMQKTTSANQRTMAKSKTAPPSSQVTEMKRKEVTKSTVVKPKENAMANANNKSKADTTKRKAYASTHHRRMHKHTTTHKKS